MRSGFGNIFIDAFSDRAADADEDGAISLLEAFLYTQNRVKTWYDEAMALFNRSIPTSTITGMGLPHARSYQMPRTGHSCSKELTLGKRRSALVDSMLSAELELDRPAMMNLRKCI